MAFDLLTIDEETNALIDEYDALIAPRRLHRSKNNKLFLVFRAIAAGFGKMRETLLSSKYRFDPRYCEDDDLESAMFITGEPRIIGKASMLRVTAFNTDPSADIVLPAGEYLYTSAEGMEFYHNLIRDVHIPPHDFGMFLFVSRQVGAHFVAGEAQAAVSRADSRQLPSFIRWEAMENSQSLGNDEETPFAMRERLLRDTQRQDSIRELEMQINQLPTIFSCDLIFNADDYQDFIMEDGTRIQSKHLLVIITGVPTFELAETIMAKTVYATQMVEQTNMIWYPHELFALGGYPVYFTYHKKRRFFLAVYYAYNPDRIMPIDVEGFFHEIFGHLKHTTVRIAEIDEPMVYQIVDRTTLPAGCRLKKLYIQEMINGELTTVVNVHIPRFALPELGGITFIGEQQAGI